MSTTTTAPTLVTGDLCDVHKGDHDGSFRVLPPSFQNYGKRVRFAGVVSQSVLGFYVRAMP